MWSFVKQLSAGLGVVACLCASLPAQTAPASAPSPVSRLQPGDIVRLRVWREPDLTGEYQVDASGHATFPKVGVVAVASIQPDSLQRLLIARYSTYLRDPSIEVAILRRIQVLGAVRNPGLYTVDPTMRIRDALALAGGATEAGEDDEVRLVRDGTQVTLELTATTSVADLSLGSGDQLFVPERSWWRRNAVTLVASAMTAGGILLGTLLAR